MMFLSLRTYLTNAVIKSLKGYEEKSLVLNWKKKCHVVVTENLHSGLLIFYEGIQVDKAKVKLIEKSPTPKSVKDV